MRKEEILNKATYKKDYEVGKMGRADAIAWGTLSESEKISKKDENAIKIRACKMAPGCVQKNER